MAIATQGTQLYFIDPTGGVGGNTPTVSLVGCVTSIDGIDTSIEQLETTCLEDKAKRFMAGLASPGTASFGINSDPNTATHIKLHQHKIAGRTLKWAVAWSDGTAAPTIDPYGELTGTNRTFIFFDGFMNSFPFSFQQNTVVQSTVGIQVSGEPEWVPKA